MFLNTDIGEFGIYEGEEGLIGFTIVGRMTMLN